MSLVSTYVLCDDGLFYKDPTLYDADWFICFDDVDLPEIVIHSKDQHTDKWFRRRAREILASVGLCEWGLRNEVRRSSRLRPPEWKEFINSGALDLMPEGEKAFPMKPNLYHGGSIEAVESEHGLSPGMSQQSVFYNFGIGEPFCRDTQQSS